MGDRRSAKSREAEAVAKREEQLRNFEKSAMYYQTIREHLARTIKFDWASMFHAACAAGDRDEVRRLLADPNDADVDCLNMDGLSALHQAAIDNNLDMVKFLVELGADINVEDRECWTPLHATVNCGHETIARFLLGRGADLVAVNCDGNLPIDIAESDEMKALIQEAVSEQGIDCDLARKREERDMTGDSIYWAIEAHALCQPHPDACKADAKSGSTALHVAAAKGYIQVMRLLIKCCKVDVNVQDLDGWTPLHAAAYWCQKNALKILLSSGADASLENNRGETYLDLANVEIEEFVKAIEREPNNKKHAARLLRGPFDFRSSKNREKDAYKKGKSCGPMCEVARIDKEIEMLDKAEKWASDPSAELEACMGDLDTGRTLLHEAAAKGYAKVMEVLVTRCYLDVDAQDCEGWTPLHLAAFHEQIEAVAYLISWGASTDIKNKKGDSCVDVSTKVMENHIYWMKLKMHRRGAPNEEELEIARKRQELKNKIMNRVNAANSRLVEKQNDAIDREPEDDSEPVSFLEPAAVPNSIERKKTDSDEPKEAIVIKEAETTITAPIERETAAIADVPADSVPKVHENMISSDDEPKANKSSNIVENDKGSATAVGNQPKLSPGNIFKNFFKSFVPPARDEESATQRKAHAKRIRETRRSTQGISLEEIQNAELLIRKNAAAANNNQSAEAAEKVSDETAATTIVSETTPQKAEEASEAGCFVAVTLPFNSNNIHNAISTTATIATGGSERRPSWRLRLDPGCKFALEDASKADVDKQHANNVVGKSVEVADTVTIPLRRPPTCAPEEKPPLERHRPQSAKYESAVPKNNIRRRSTGISQIINDQNDESVKKEDAVDYKKLYERSQLEVERLNKIIKSYEEQTNSKGFVDKINLSESSENEKREKRALQRKLSEMEEELHLQKALQTENQRLKEENGALIRVISKLSK